MRPKKRWMNLLHWIRRKHCKRDKINSHIYKNNRPSTCFWILFSQLATFFLLMFFDSKIGIIIEPTSQNWVVENLTWRRPQGWCSDPPPQPSTGQVRDAGVPHAGTAPDTDDEASLHPAFLAPGFPLVHCPVLISAYRVSLFQVITCLFFCLTSVLEHTCSVRSRIFLSFYLFPWCFV